MLWAFRCIVFARKWKNSSKNNASIYFCGTEPSELVLGVNRPSDFDRIRSKAYFIKRPCTNQMKPGHSKAIFHVKNRPNLSKKNH
jgi:hypothetical protein